MESHIIEMTGVNRAFGGKTAVSNMNLRVKRGSIYGFLGRNGAGKTTTIKLLAGLIWPDSGTIRVNGVEPAKFTVEDRRKIGYVSEKQMLMPSLRVKRLIEFTSSFYPDWDFALCDRVLKKFKIDPAQRIKNLSQGTQRQVAMLLALAQRPDLLILDEPAANLDVVARREFLDEVLDLIREEGKSVFISTHILSDVERVADEIGIMADGALKISESLDTLKETVKRVRFYDFAAGTNGFTLPDAFQLTRTGDEAVATLRVSSENTLRSIASAHSCQFEILDLGLEDIFIDVVRESGGKP